MREKIIEGSKIYLSQIEHEDIKGIMIWRNNQMNILRQSKPLNMEDQEIWWKSVSLSKSMRLFSIINNHEEMIGYCGITNINEDCLRGEISFLLNPKIKENSEEYEEIFLEVLKMLLNFGFNELNLNRIFTETYEYRKNHIVTLEKAGLIREGTLREHIFKQGKFYNSVVHSIIMGDYENGKK